MAASVLESRVGFYRSGMVWEIDLQKTSRPATCRETVPDTGSFDGEAVLHIGLEQSVVGFVHFLDGDDFDICGDVMGATKIQHLLGFGETANG